MGSTERPSETPSRLVEIKNAEIAAARHHLNIGHAFIGMDKFATKMKRLKGIADFRFDVKTEGVQYSGAIVAAFGKFEGEIEIGRWKVRSDGNSELEWIGLHDTFPSHDLGAFLNARLKDGTVQIALSNGAEKLAYRANGITGQV